jgi:NADH-quinone oxidoreductase subunit C/D
MIAAPPTIAQEIKDRLGQWAMPQETHDHIPTFWVAKDRVSTVLRFLKEEVERPYKMLYDLSAIDERMRVHRDGQPASDLTVVYHLLSFARNEYIRIEVALAEGQLSLPSITDIWPAANWYER